MRYLRNFDLSKIEKIQFDVLIIGSGITGLFTALNLKGLKRIGLLTKDKLEKSETAYAQGGIAGVVSNNDSIDSHVEDTLKVGDGIGVRDRVKILVEEGTKRIKDLEALGVSFDRINNEYDLNREGGHSIPRIVHKSDYSGSEIIKTLIKEVKQSKGITVFEDYMAVDLIKDGDQCHGLVALDVLNEKLIFFKSTSVILATGGAGQVYSTTTNPQVSTGDGVAMAFRANTKLSDLEFFQFHPTALYEQVNPRFLITEALRGEGAVLRDKNGDRFLQGIHPDADLAPRDFVVREMFKKLKRDKCEHLYLDATGVSEKVMENKFFSIFQKCKEEGIDISKDYIPVFPAAHFLIGGILIDEWGRTNIKGLFAAGESANSFIHGANRLASNSLLEGLVFGKRIADYILSDCPNQEFDLENNYNENKGKWIGEISLKRNLLQEIMFEYVGIRRNVDGLKKAEIALNDFDRLLECDLQQKDGLELQNLVIISKLIIKAALMRKESRGVHFREDFPEHNDKEFKKHLVLEKDNDSYWI